jgi:hypothetical protein
MIATRLEQEFSPRQRHYRNSAVQIERIDMKHTKKAILVAAVCGLLAAGASPADAKGCIKGAVVGGLAGHMAGHGVLGAAGGCAVGHHMANKAEREDGNQPQPQQQSSNSYNQNHP